MSRRRIRRRGALPREPEGVCPQGVTPEKAGELAVGEIPAASGRRAIPEVARMGRGEGWWLGSPKGPSRRVKGSAERGGPRGSVPGGIPGSSGWETEWCQGWSKDVGCTGRRRVRPGLGTGGRLPVPCGQDAASRGASGGIKRGQPARLGLWDKGR